MTFRFKYNDLHFWTGRIQIEVLTTLPLNFQVFFDRN